MGWGNVAGITLLTIEFSDSPQTPRGRIYANGHNQTKVTVKVQARKSNNDIVLLPSQDEQQCIFDHLYLVDMSNMRHLAWNGHNSSWNYTTVQNHFYTTPSGSRSAPPDTPPAIWTVGTDGVISYVFYVMCAPREPLRSIAVAVQVLGVPDGHDGTNDFNSGGNSMNLPRSYVTIESIDPENFTQQQMGTTHRRLVDGVWCWPYPSTTHQPIPDYGQCYLDIHIWSMPANLTIADWDWVDQNWAAKAYCAASQNSSHIGSRWLIYGGVYPPNKGNGQSTHANYGGVFGISPSGGPSYFPDDGSTPHYNVPVEPNTLVVSKVIGTKYTFTQSGDINYPSRTASIYVVDNYGTRRRICFEPMHTDYDYEGPTVTPYMTPDDLTW